MLKRINQIVNTIIGCSIGVFIGHAIYVYGDYISHPALYAMQSAPWYTSILVYGGFSVTVVVFAFIVKYIIRKMK